MSRVLLDHNVPARLARALTGHEVGTAQQERWQEVKDGPLLRRAEKDFDVLVTCDRSLPRQNSIGKLDLGVIVLVAPTNRLAELLPLAPRVLAALEDIQPGEVRVIEAE